MKSLLSNNSGFMDTVILDNVRKVPMNYNKFLAFALQCSESGEFHKYWFYDYDN